MSRLCSYAFLTFLFLPTHGRADDSLAVIEAGVQSSEDAPFVQADYRFQAGEFVYTTFQIAGFQAKRATEEQPRKVAMTYKVTPEDANGVALCPPVSDKIEEELNAEDKNWTPKRRVSFLIPSFVAAGQFQIHIVVNDLIGKAETSKVVPFRIGGIAVARNGMLSVQDFQFFRRENDRQPAEVPAYSAGDSVFVRFVMTRLQGRRQERIPRFLSTLRNAAGWQTLSRSSRCSRTCFRQFLSGAIPSRRIYLDDFAR